LSAYYHVVMLSCQIRLRVVYNESPAQRGALTTVNARPVSESKWELVAFVPEQRLVVRDERGAATAYSTSRSWTWVKAVGARQG
jgi:hypothetical protein